MKIFLTKRNAASIMKIQNIRERDDGKKYLCLKADRELPVGERREKDRREYTSRSSRAERLISRLCRQAPIFAGVLMDTQ